MSGAGAAKVWACDHDPPLARCRKCFLAGKTSVWPPAELLERQTPLAGGAPPGDGWCHGPPLPACAELGPPLLEQPPCGCAEKLRSCRLHDTCTTLTPRPEAARVCATCRDHTARTG